MQKGIGGCTCCVLIFGFVLSGIRVVDQTEMCLNYNVWTSTVSENVYSEPGLSYFGPFNSKICYPNTNKYLYFRENALNGGLMGAGGDIYRGPIEVRTQDGLTVKLEMEFTYKLRAFELRQLYMTVGNDGYESHMVHLAEGVVCDHATTFTAEEFFSNRTLVSGVFEYQIREILGTVLFVDVQTLQLQPAHFPAEYSKTIDDTQAQRQDIAVAAQERTVKLIAKSTALKEATIQAKKVLIAADADAQTVKLLNVAHVDQYKYKQSQQAEGNSDVFQFFVDASAAPDPAAKTADAGENFLDYITVAALGLHGDGLKSFLLDAQPATAAATAAPAR